ncbi:hypothetical protein F2Q69_00029325 [Brassica cretica]|uniref:Uncharacterized protein n=1 Tax=Brassica cretica TaxID=69181 RepID=A0A8S9RSN2_BRACR|nr:hypothetical protein F2Q69_00029325 [Brassica cretica]
MHAISLEDVIMFCFLWAVRCSSVLCDILGFPGVDWRYKEEAVTRYGGGCGEGVVVLLELKGPKIKLIVMRTKTDFERASSSLRSPQWLWQFRLLVDVFSGGEPIWGSFGDNLFCGELLKDEVLGSSNAKRINNLPVDVEAVPPTILSNPVSRFNCVLAIPHVVLAESITAMSRAYGHTTYEWYVIGMDIIL